MNRQRLITAASKYAARGFTLIEALIALVVVAAGALAVAGLQAHMSRASDVAKQRSEAVRLAQQKLEELRSFDSSQPIPIGGTAFPGDYNYQQRVVSGSDAPTDPATTNSNTAFTRSWSVTRDGVNPAAPNEPHKWVAVTVTWTDRAGEAQNVTLRTVIANADPIEQQLLITGPGQTKTRQPKNRSVDIPYPAVDIGNGKSAFTPPGAANQFYVFDNVTGLVLAKCNFALPTDPAQLVNLDISGCTNYGNNTYLLSGYIRFFNGTNQSQLDQRLVNSTDDTFPLQATIVFVPVNGLVGDAVCFTERRAMLQNQFTSVVDNGSLGTTVASRFVAYTCIVQGVDHDSNTTTKPVWSGQFVVTPGAGWLLGTANDRYLLCRYTGDYKRDDKISNAEHPLYYRYVTGTLDNQNYIAVRGLACPTSPEPNPLTASSDAEYLNLNTVIHQSQAYAGETAPRDNHFGGNFSTTTSQWPSTGAEPTDRTQQIPMN